MVDNIPPARALTNGRHGDRNRLGCRPRIPGWPARCSDTPRQGERTQASRLQSTQGNREFSNILYDSLTTAQPIHVSYHKQGRLTEKIYADVESSFKSHSRALVAMAGSLNRSRELRSFFVDLVERCVEPLKQARWTSRDLRIFLDFYTPAGVQLLKRFPSQLNHLRKSDSFFTFVLNSDSATAAVWERYMKVIGSCLVKIYHN